MCLLIFGGEPVEMPANGEITTLMDASEMKLRGTTCTAIIKYCQLLVRTFFPGKKGSIKLNVFL